MVKCTKGCGIGCTAASILSLMGAAAITVGAKARTTAQVGNQLAYKLGMYCGWDRDAFGCDGIRRCLDAARQQELSYSIAALALGVITVAGVVIIGCAGSYCMSRNVERY